MKTRKAIGGLLLAVLVPCTAWATIAWQGDLGVSISGVKNTGPQTITYTVTVTNNGDDDAPDPVVLVHVGTKTISSASATNGFTCSTTSGATPAHYYARCTASALANGQSSTVTVVVNNAGNGGNEAAAQVSGTAPDQVPSNNGATSVL